MEMNESSNTKIILILVLVLLFAGVYLYSQQQKPEVVGVVDIVPQLTHFKEAFQSQEVPDGIIEEVIGSKATYPNAKNPFMNVLIDEIKYNPKRAQAASVLDPSVSVTLDDFFRTQFVDDPTDVFGKTQSQREFYTMPSTTIPNDQDSYQNWLYRIPGKTCKEGNCTSTGTTGAVIPWLSEN